MQPFRFAYFLTFLFNVQIGRQMFSSDSFFFSLWTSDLTSSLFECRTDIDLKWTWFRAAHLIIESRKGHFSTCQIHILVRAVHSTYAFICKLLRCNVCVCLHLISLNELHRLVFFPLSCSLIFFSVNWSSSRAEQMLLMYFTFKPCRPIPYFRFCLYIFLLPSFRFVSFI